MQEKKKSTNNFQNIVSTKRKKINFSHQRETLCKILYKIGFTWKRTQNKIYKERYDSVIEEHGLKLWDFQHTIVIWIQLNVPGSVHIFSKKGQGENNQKGHFLIDNKALSSPLAILCIYYRLVFIFLFKRGRA